MRRPAGWNSPTTGPFAHARLHDLPTPDGHRKARRPGPELALVSERRRGRPDFVLAWRCSDKPPVGAPWRLRIVDPSYYLFAETHTYPGIFWHDLMGRREKEARRATYRRRLRELFAKLGAADAAFVFGTGPSIQRLGNYDVHSGVRIICNSAVRNQELLEAVRPQVICFTDSVFHFGVSDYAEAFLADLRVAAEAHDSWIVANEVGAALVAAQYPELAERMIGVPAVRFGPPRRVTPDRPGTRDYKNILTRYMLPLAAGLAREVRLLGFDGRAPDETYFWKHDAKTQYTDRMNNAKRVHPAFFRDIDYDGYYRAHCETLERMTTQFEAEGVRIAVLGSSHIPALASRIVG